MSLIKTEMTQRVPIMISTNSGPNHSEALCILSHLIFITPYEVGDDELQLHFLILGNRLREVKQPFQGFIANKWQLKISTQISLIPKFMP